ncbi:MAG: hypothetical protein ACP5OO_06215 [Chloroflexia bacterium]
MRASPGIPYAAPMAQGSGEGFSWANACSLQSALAQAVSGNEIWVMQAVRSPTTDPDDRTAPFAMTSGVAFYDGFEGTEDSR